MSRLRLDAALTRLDHARSRTLEFLTDLTPEEWFWSPREVTTHIAWQVGHLAVAQYNLCLRRIRGRTAADESLISDAFIDLFKLGTNPSAAAASYPPPAEIRRVLDAVHRQSLAELAGRTDEELDVPVEVPHPAFKTKLDAVDYAPSHEYIHVGQVALLRRLMGRAPLR